MWECIYLRSHFLPPPPFSVLLNKYTEVRLLDHMVVLSFIFFFNFENFCFAFYNPPKIHRGSNFSTSLSTICCFFVCFVCGFLSSVIFPCFGNSHPNKCKVILLWLWFPSPWLLVMGTFYIPVVHLYILFEDMSIEVCCLFLNWITSLFFAIKLEEFLTCFGY